MSNTDAILATLKDFQVDTVEYVFSRMWDEDDPADRFLVADEVGLGKTMVAKGIVAKTIDHLRAKGQRHINIVYVSSNAHITRQNLSRLNAVGANDLQHADRLTLLPLALKEMEENEINFISLTPGTSLETGRNLGRSDERALLYRLVANHMGEELLASRAWAEFFRGGRGLQNFLWDVEKVDMTGLSPQMLADFSAAFSQADGLSGGTLMDELTETAVQFGTGDATDRKLRGTRNRLIGALRNLVATVSLDFLKPDLIILDEFQRFKTLLEPDVENPTEAQELAAELFGADHAKLLLLSATPYKMFTLADDPEGNDHYSDFLATVEFLAGPDRTKRVADGLATMRSGIYETKAGNAESGREKIEVGRSQAQQELRRVMSRTERLAATKDRNGMLSTAHLGDPKLEPEDVRGWVKLDQVRRHLEVPYDGFEYWRSAPYPLSMMNQNSYVVSRALHEAVDAGGDRNLATILRGSGGAFPWKNVDAHRPVPPENAKLRALSENVLDKHEAWRIAWMPPSLPYHQPGGDYAKPEIQAFSKRLIFSSWGVVPKSIASMISYEAERRRLEDSPNPVRPYGVPTTPPFRLRTTPDGRPENLAAITLMYPSVSLARLGDPLQIARELAAETAATEDAASNEKNTPNLASADQVVEVIEQRVQTKLDALPAYKNRKRLGESSWKAGNVQHAADEVDNRWYSVVPFLFDEADGLGSMALHDLWDGSEEDEEDENATKNQEALPQEQTPQEPTSRALRALRRLLRREPTAEPPAPRKKPATHQKELSAHLDALDRIDEMDLGPPPENLTEVIAMFALASPGTVFLRALARVSGAPFDSTIEDLEVRSLAFKLANRLRLLFNRQEIAYLLHKTPQTPYWKAMLQMGIDGNLQAVIDEYFHTLVESEGLQDAPPPVRTKEIAQAMESALALRAMPNDINQFIPHGSSVRLEKRNLSAHFAALYGRQQVSDKTVVHEDQLRRAFNSPFRPFVLASTSVGQEGLDFHNYSHSVVHWNLPSNPVDLEQREGRVHRYKGHAVRKNVAADFRAAALRSEDAGGQAGPWKAMFDEAERTRDPEQSDIVPYWVYAKEGGATIERYVPAMPFSRETRHLDGLLRTVSEYRQVIGQPRQDDLLHFLSEGQTAPEEESVSDGQTDLTDLLGMDLEPPRAP